MISALKFRRGWTAAICGFLMICGVWQMVFASSADAYPRRPVANSANLQVNGGGAYVTNAASGYYMGRMRDGELFRVVSTSGLDRWGWSESRGRCMWIGPQGGGPDVEYLGTSIGEGTASACTSTLKTSLADRATIGKNFNCAANRAAGGSRTVLSGSTPFYHNLQWSSNYQSLSIGANTQVTTLPYRAIVQYRFTTNDNVWAVVNVLEEDGNPGALGWGFVLASSLNIPSGGTFNYYSEGGASRLCNRNSPTKGTVIPAPATTIASPANGFTTANTEVSVAFSGSAAGMVSDPTIPVSVNVTVDHHECSIDAGAWYWCSSPRVFPSLAPGAHTIRVRTVDSTLQAGPSAEITVVRDNTPPLVTISSPASGETLSLSSANASFTANETATFRCKWDEGSFQPCTSPAATLGLADGSHTVTVEATDAAGNVGSSVTSFNVASSSPPPEAMVMPVRGNAGTAEVLHDGQLFRFGSWSWNQGCMSGFQPVGDLTNANGFRVCVRSDLASRRFFIGNVVNNGAGNFYEVNAGTVTYFGDRGWSYCPSGSQLLGQFVNPNGFWMCMAADGDPGADAMLMLVRSNVGSGHLIYKGEDFSYGSWSWNQGCAVGLTPVGDLVDSNGFRLCVRSGLANRRFFVGHVVSNGAGNMYQVNGGTVTYLGGRAWSYCPSGTQLVGQYVNPNGYWLCMASAGDPGPQAMLMLVRNNAGYGHLVYAGEDWDFGAWSWNQWCMSGFQLIGDLANANGFRVCARSDLATRRYYIGNVVNNGPGLFYQLLGGTVTQLANRNWSSCPAGSQLIGQAVHANGYWLCLEN